MMNKCDEYILINPEKLLELCDETHPMAANLLVLLAAEAAFEPVQNRERGQVVTTLEKLSGRSKKTLQNKEKALKMLEEIGEISVEKLDGDSLLITVLQFDNSLYWKFPEDGE